MQLQFSPLLLLLILVAFVIRTIRNSLYHLFLWQNKEYRLDRMLVHFETSEGKRFLYGPISLTKSILVITYLIAIFVPFGVPSELSAFIDWSYGLILLLEAGKNIREFYLNSLPLPKFSLKIWFILGLTLFVQFIFQSPLSLSYFSFRLRYLLLLDKSLGFIIAIQIALFSIPARLRNRLIERKAKQKSANLSNLKVIGITGSYGKTSAKEFTEQLLNRTFKVVKTPANENTAIGNAKAILQRVGEDTDYFVMEAAAYRRGEIKRITELVEGRLETAVLTGLNEQHLDLFGSLKNIAEAKYELIEALPFGNKAVFNAENDRVRKLANRASTQGFDVYLYGHSPECFARAYNISVYPEKLSFTLKMGDKSAEVEVPLLGKHNVENVLAAVAVSNLSGVKWKELVARVQELSPPPQTMRLHKIDKINLIDDTYNANPDGVYAALDYLDIYDCSKITVLRPLIELGPEAERIHIEIGYRLGKVCEGVILTNGNYRKQLVKGISAADKSAIVRVITSEKESAAFIRKTWPEEKVVLFEGREAERVLEQWSKRSKEQ